MASRYGESRFPISIGRSSALVSKYATLNFGLSSARVFRWSQIRVVAMFAWPSHSCTLAMS